jgi:hypothetical protein
MKTIPRLMLVCLVALFSVNQASADSHEAIASVKNLNPYFIKEDVNLGVYSKVFLEALQVNYARVIAPPWYEGEDKNPKKWSLTDKDEEFLRKSYRTAMIEALQAGGYPVVEEIADKDVLSLTMKIVALMPYARKGENVQVRGFGEMTVQATLRDGQTGELLAIFEGPQDVGSDYQQNSRLNAENSLKELFDIWGQRMRKVMDDSRE